MIASTKPALAFAPLLPDLKVSRPFNRLVMANVGQWQGGSSLHRHRAAPEMRLWPILIPFGREWDSNCLPKPEISGQFTSNERRQRAKAD
jgi:hypothetical protein